MQRLTQCLHQHFDLVEGDAEPKRSPRSDCVSALGRRRAWKVRISQLLVLEEQSKFDLRSWWDAFFVGAEQCLWRQSQGRGSHCLD